MATGGRKLYQEDDEVDENLLNKLSPWILYGSLPSLARDLGFQHAELDKILFKAFSPTEDCFQVRGGI